MAAVILVLPVVPALVARAHHVQVHLDLVPLAQVLRDVRVLVRRAHRVARDLLAQHRVGREEVALRLVVQNQVGQGLLALSPAAQHPADQRETQIADYAAMEKAARLGTQIADHAAMEKAARLGIQIADHAAMETPGHGAMTLAQPIAPVVMMRVAQVDHAVMMIAVLVVMRTVMIVRHDRVAPNLQVQQSQITSLAMKFTAQFEMNLEVCQTV